MSYYALGEESGVLAVEESPSACVAQESHACLESTGTQDVVLKLKLFTCLTKSVFTSKLEEEAAAADLWARTIFMGALDQSAGGHYIVKLFP
ncbi:hypothetical protein scyTo_0025192, partial [Scyliorhinus torazame]|nr:hypothetical protein [Scyliorhinus torazame]